MFRTCPLFIIRSFSLYTQQWYMSYRFADSLGAGSGRSVLILLAALRQRSKWKDRSINPLSPVLNIFKKF